MTDSGSQRRRVFLGQHEVAVDSQRRLAIPRQWRRGGEGGAEFVLVPGRDGAVHLMPLSAFDEFLEKLEKVSFADRKAARALARIGSLMEECSCDKQGRITLTPKLLEHAGITDRATLLGSVTTIQIYRPEAWAEEAMDTDDVLDVVQGLQERPDELSEVFKRTLKD